MIVSNSDSSHITQSTGAMHAQSVGRITDQTHNLQLDVESLQYNDCVKIRTKVTRN